MDVFNLLQEDIFIKLILAVLLGSIIGIERYTAGKDAGMKTHALVALGATLFVIISEALFFKYQGTIAIDPSRVLSQVVVGIGFLGAGLIMFHDNRLSGLSTASGLWVTAGIGASIGFGFYNLALLSTVLVLVVFLLIGRLEKPLFKLLNKHGNNNDN